MSDIIHRVGGVPLTATQIDANFASLNNTKLEKTSDVDSVLLPTGTTAQRPASIGIGAIRFNTDLNDFEGYYTVNGWTTVGAKGYTGSTAPNIVGATGPIGSVGATGLYGSIGNTGSPGAAGATGPTGLTGATGNAGPIGPTGSAGNAGATGLTGSVGPTGSAGPYSPYTLVASTPTVFNYNSSSVTFSTQLTTPGQEATRSAGVAFNANGSIYVSRRSAPTVAPHYGGAFYVSRSIAGTFISFRWNNTSAQVNCSITLNGSTYYMTHVASGGMSLQIYNSTSDYRIKEKLSISKNNVDKLKKIKLYNFSFLFNNIKKLNFIAHQLQEIIPNAVHGTKDEVDENGNPIMQGIFLIKMVPFLLATIKELDQKLTNITTKVQEKYANNI